MGTAIPKDKEPITMRDPILDRIEDYKERYQMRAKLGTHFIVAVVCRNPLEKRRLATDIQAYSDDEFTFLPLSIGDDIYGIKAHSVLYTNWAKEVEEHDKEILRLTKGQTINSTLRWIDQLYKRVNETRGEDVYGIFS